MLRVGAITLKVIVNTLWRTLINSHWRLLCTIYSGMLFLKKKIFVPSHEKKKKKKKRTTRFQEVNEQPDRTTLTPIISMENTKAVIVEEMEQNDDVCAVYID